MHKGKAEDYEKYINRYNSYIIRYKRLYAENARLKMNFAKCKRIKKIYNFLKIFYFYHFFYQNIKKYDIIFVRVRFFSKK